MKKTGFKYQIEQELLQINCEIIEIDSADEWWIDESWKLQFKFGLDVYLFICFLVDPHSEIGQNQGQRVSEVRVSTKFPQERSDREGLISSLCMINGIFEENLKEFMIDLDKFLREDSLTRILNQGD